MDEQLVTVFRSADPGAREQAEEIVALLEDAGLHPVLLDDSAPGVPVGAWQVQVPAEEAQRAEAILQIAQDSEAEADLPDASAELDLEEVFGAMGATAEIEALNVRALLDANGVPSVLVCSTPYPNLEFVIKVPRRLAARAREIIRDAQVAGPAAAAEAEAASEGVSNPTDPEP